MKLFTKDLIMAAPELLEALEETVAQLYASYSEPPESERFKRYENIVAKAQGRIVEVEHDYGFTVNIYANGENVDEAWSRAQAHVAEYGLPKWTDYQIMESE